MQLIKAIKTLKGDETLEQTTQLRQKKYLNNIIEQAHRLFVCEQA
ncbi:hypothetical protein [Dendronalium sp. ChiSLP03b]|nr:hypothetical protein [Dendronalium sp. ChiSLP03b]MDZ8203177.1 hypothetical protein [Dendronalium sp. ChiSLP03b]